MYPILIQNKLIEIYSYPFFLGIAVAVAYILFEIRTKLPNKNFLFFLTTLISFVGAKIFFILVNRNFHLLDDQNFWLGGGFVFYGGLIFGSLFLLIYFKIKKISLYELNLIVVPLIFAHAIGRWGCFLAGCCYGHNHFPIQLVEFIFLIILGIYLLKYQRLEYHLSSYFIAYSSFRFFIEYFRDDFRGQLFTRYLTPSQEIALLILSFSLFFLLRKIKRFNIDV